MKEDRGREGRKTREGCGLGVVHPFRNTAMASLCHQACCTLVCRQVRPKPERGREEEEEEEEEGCSVLEPTV